MVGVSKGSSVKGSPEDKPLISASYIKGNAKISRRVTLALYTGINFYCGHLTVSTASALADLDYTFSLIKVKCFPESYSRNVRLINILERVYRIFYSSILQHK